MARFNYFALQYFGSAADNAWSLFGFYFRGNNTTTKTDFYGSHEQPSSGNMPLRLRLPIVFIILCRFAGHSSASVLGPAIQNPK
ncbi:MAG: hypothetical protein J5I94_18790 [Phaeodactylibacter sp.]|nr:hypothetical protein [Phaeodactylibacter sp.]